jgi:hypothetical protein
MFSPLLRGADNQQGENMQYVTNGGHMYSILHDITFKHFPYTLFLLQWYMHSQREA